MPFGDVTIDRNIKDAKRDRFKADVQFYWVSTEGKLHEAPHAQLIFYPKYPEVRLSGLSKGAAFAPTHLLPTRHEGRILFLGLTGDGRMLGHAIGADNPIADVLRGISIDVPETVFEELTLSDADDDRTRLFTELRRVVSMGWIRGQRLDGNGKLKFYKAQNGGGYTLEAMLGITPNGYNEPDLYGWEIKQHAVTSLDQPLSGGAITLMTPEPTGGVYREPGFEQFMQTYGYPDVKGRPGRINFGGIHRFGSRTSRTGLVLELRGFDLDRGRIEDVNGGILLTDRMGEIAAMWDFGKLIEKWKRKHSKAVYIPSISRDSEYREYRYGQVVETGEGTDFALFLRAVGSGAIYYDPGIKMITDERGKIEYKKRSQFRIRPRGLHVLYDDFREVDILVER